MVKILFAPSYSEDIGCCWQPIVIRVRAVLPLANAAYVFASDCRAFPYMPSSQSSTELLHWAEPTLTSLPFSALRPDQKTKSPNIPDFVQPEF
jgi:hypothetical protein